jgi:hypothetical protein
MAVALVVAGGAVAGVVDRPTPAAADVRPAAGQYVPVTATRTEPGKTVPAKGTAEFAVLGRGGVPASGVSAVRFTLSTLSAGSGWMVAYPSGASRMGASHLNFAANVWDTNAVVMAPGAGGRITVYNDGGSDATLVVDVVGYYRAAGATVAGDTFVPLQPGRIFTGQVTAGGTVLVEPLGKSGIPTANVTTVLAHVTVSSSGAGNVTAYPDGATRPLTSDISFTGTGPFTNQVPARLGANGKFRVYSAGAGTITVDIVGYYQPPTATTAGSSFVPLTPARIFADQIIEPDATKTFLIAGKGGVPTTGVAAVAVNLTADDQDANSGALSMWAADQPVPIARQLSYRPGTHTPTLQVSRLAADGTVIVRNVSAGPVRVLIDVAGYYRAAAAPPPPTAVTAQAGDAQTIVRWTAPTGDGGAAITGYRVTATPGGSTVDVADVTSAVFANLTNGTAYTFTVAARNAVGVGAAGPASAAATPLAATAPGAPTSVTARARHTAAVVSWQRPADDGRLAIERYTVTASPGGATATVAAPGTEVEVPGLINGTSYTFRVTATNARGTGAASAAGPAVVPAPSAPDVPTDVVAGASGAGAITVEWAAPAYDGGGAVTGYTVTVQPGGRAVSVPPTEPRTTVTGLTAGTAYTFAVTATNARGTGPAETTEPVTPDLVLRAGTRELSAAALATLTAVTATTVTFTSAPAEVTGVPVGAILVAPEPPDPHEPFLVTVTGVRTSGATTTLQVEPATITQAYTDAAFAITSDLADSAADGDLRAAAGAAASGPITETFTEELVPGVRLTGVYTSSVRPEVKFSVRGDKQLILHSTDRYDLTLTADRKVDNLGNERMIFERVDKLSKLPKKLKPLKYTKPGLRWQLHGFARGNVHAGFTAKTSAEVRGTMIVNLADPEDSSITFTRVYEPPSVSAIANGDVTFGVRAHFAVMSWNRVAIEEQITNEVRANVNVNADPWWTVDHCLKTNLFTNRFAVNLNPFVVNLTQDWGCRRVRDAGGPLPLLDITPGDVSVPTGGTAQFRAGGPYGSGTPRWSVDGGDANGRINQNGFYTAPARDGIFAVVAVTDATGGRPAQRGTAYVRVGAPPQPTLFVTPLPATALGTPLVGVGFHPNGPSPLLWRIRVEPVNPSSPCWANAWITFGILDSDILADVLATDTSIRCDILRIGGTYRFYLTAMNQYGNSVEATAPPVTILGPAAANGGAPVRVTGIGGG